MRLHLPRVIPIEVWDLDVAGKPLQEWRDDTAFARRLGEIVQVIRSAPPSTFDARARSAAPAIAHVHIAGGDASSSLAEALGHATRLATTHASDPFAPARAGAMLVPDALCADIGQTSIKLVHRDRTWRVDRDLVRAPLRDGVALDQRDPARDSTIRFLGSLLAGDHSRVVVGLPCELRADGLPRSCTYCWRDPDPELVPELERLAAHPIEIVNDAELAALAASAVAPSDRVTLVLTIGFGVGGALLVPA